MKNHENHVTIGFWDEIWSREPQDTKQRYCCPLDNNAAFQAFRNWIGAGDAPRSRAVFKKRIWYNNCAQGRRQRGARLRILAFNNLSNQIIIIIMSTKTKRNFLQFHSLSLRTNYFNQMTIMLLSCPTLITKKSGHTNFQKKSYRNSRSIQCRRNGKLPEISYLPRPRRYMGVGG